MAALGASQWMRMTKEAAWGTFDTTATSGNIMWIRLTDGGSFVAEPDPQTWDVRGADGFNLRQQRGAPVTMFPFSLKTVLYPAQAPNLVNWGLTPVSNVLPSYTIDYWDGIEVRRLLGCRVATGKLGTDSSSFVMNFEVSGYGQTASTTTLAQPASTVFVSERPYVHQDSAAACLYGATTSTPTLALYDSIEVSWKNVLDARAFESTYIQICDYNGRDVDFALKRLLTANAERIAFQNQALRAATIAWAVTTTGGYSGNHSLSLALQSNSYVGGRTVTRSFDRDQDEQLSMMSYKDGTTGTDLVVTCT